MAGPGGWKGTIQLGMVSIPVSAKSAVREERFAFNGHHDPAICDGSGGRLRMQPAVCEDCGMEVPKDHQVRGYKGVVGIDEDYLKSLQQAKAEVITIDRLVDAGDVDTRYFEKSYDCVAEKGGEKPYVMLHDLLVTERKIAIGSAPIGGADTIIAIRAHEGVLAMELLYWESELTAAGTVEQAKRSIEGVSITKDELELAKLLAKQLGETNGTAFEPTAYVDNYSVAMNEYLTAFLEGEAAPALPEREEAPTATVDLMAALSASVASLEKPAKKSRKKKAA